MKKCNKNKIMIELKEEGKILVSNLIVFVYEEEADYSKNSYYRDDRLYDASHIPIKLYMYKSGSFIYEENNQFHALANGFKNIFQITHAIIRHFIPEDAEITENIYTCNNEKFWDTLAKELRNSRSN